MNTNRGVCDWGFRTQAFLGVLQLDPQSQTKRRSHMYGPSSPRSFSSHTNTTAILKCKADLGTWELPRVQVLASVGWQRGPFLFCLHKCLQTREKGWPQFTWLLPVCPQAEAEDGLLLYCGESEHGRGDFMSLALIRRSLHFR